MSGLTPEQVDRLNKAEAVIRDNEPITALIKPIGVVVCIGEEVELTDAEEDRGVKKKSFEVEALLSTSGNSLIFSFGVEMETAQGRQAQMIEVVYRFDSEIWQYTTLVGNSPNPEVLSNLAENGLNLSKLKNLIKVGKDKLLAALTIPEKPFQMRIWDVVVVSNFLKSTDESDNFALGIIERLSDGGIDPVSMEFLLVKEKLSQMEQATLILNWMDAVGNGVVDLGFDLS